MDASTVINFFKKAAKSLVAGVAGAITSSDEVKLVPAIAPIPVSDVNEQYGRAEPVERPKKEEAGPKYEELVEERIKEVAFKKSMPYQPEVALFKGGLVKKETIAKVGEKEPEVVTPVKNYAESVELVYKQGAALLISSSLGFLDTLPPSKGKSTIRKEANRLAAIFGIVNSPKPQKTIGLSSKLEWWGGSTGTSGGRDASGKDGGSKNEKMSKKDEEGISKGLPKGLLKNVALVGGAATLFGAGYYIPKMFPSTAKSKTDNAVEDFTEKKLLEKTTDGEGNKKELTEYESILAERESIEETIAELEKELEEKQKNRSGFTNFLKGTVMGETGEIKAQIKELQEKLNKKREDGKLYYYAIKSPKEQEESDAFDELLYGKEANERFKKAKEKEAAAWKDPDPFKHDKYYRPIVLNPPTANAWEKAVNAAKKDGINLPRHVTSSYRSAEDQAALVSAAQKGMKGIVNPAKPGQSAHGQGWAIDIISPSPANDWMKMNAKQFGFEWQGEHDPVHFDFITNEENTKYLQHGNDSWIPEKNKSKTIEYRDRYDPTPGEISTKAALQSWRESNPNIDPCNCPPPVSTINEEPVNQGVVNGTGNVVPIPQIIPVPQTKIIPVPIIQNTENEEEYSKTIIDPFSKAVISEVV
tara:strand:- start:3243 stop:5174 length:1932 start_codon:yes stop_codon:yes gene_type:complete